MTSPWDDSHFEPSDKDSKNSVANVLSALSLMVALFFGIEAIQSREQNLPINPEQSTSQKCETFYNDMAALNDSGLSVEGLAQITDPREEVCGPAHTVPYVWNVPSQADNEGPEENQTDEEVPAPSQ